MRLSLSIDNKTLPMRLQHTAHAVLKYCCLLRPVIVLCGRNVQLPPKSIVFGLTTGPLHSVQVQILRLSLQVSSEPQPSIIQLQVKPWR